MADSTEVGTIGGEEIMSSGADKGIELLECLIRGGEKAVAEFNELSGGDRFDEAPEYFLTTYLASSIKEFEKTTALLEVHVGETRKKAGAIRRGRSAKKERRNGRFDIVVYWANGKPRGAIEVKSPLWIVDEKKLGPDFDELSTAISASNDSTFQFTAFVYYASVSKPKPNQKHSNSSKKLRDLVAKIHDRAKGAAKEHKLVAISRLGSVHRDNSVEGRAWCLAAIVFARKSGGRSFQE